MLLGYLGIMMELSPSSTLISSQTSVKGLGEGVEKQSNGDDILRFSGLFLLDCKQSVLLSLSVLSFY